MGLQSTDFSYFLGGVALMGTVTSLVLYTHSYLPNSQMKILDELLGETRKIYEKSVAEDLLQGQLKSELGETLTGLEKLQEQLREQTYQAVTIWAQYVGLFRGLSMGIIDVTGLAKGLRSRVVTTSEKTKQRREQDHAVSQSSSAAHPADAALSESRTCPDPPIRILENPPMPVACPPANRSTTTDNQSSTLVDGVTPSSLPNERNWYWYSPQRWKFSLSRAPKPASSESSIAEV